MPILSVSVRSVRSSWASPMANDHWHFDGREYRPVNPKMVSYPRSEKRKVNGRMVLVKLPPLQYSIVTGELVGNEGLARTEAQDLD